MTNQSQLPDKKRLAPERIWISPRQAELYAKAEYLRDPSDTEEYVRADLLQQPTSERYCIHCGRRDTNADYCGKQRGLQKCVFPATAADEGELVDEAQRRMDAVVEAAVGWHQSGEEGDGSWFDKGGVLEAAIESLLELRAASPANVAEGEAQHHKLCSIWTGSTSGLRNPCDCVCFCGHGMAQHIRHGDDSWFEECAASDDCDCIKFDAKKVREVTPSVTTSEPAIEAARELDRRALLHDSKCGRPLTDGELQPVVEIINRYYGP